MNKLVHKFTHQGGQYVSHLAPSKHKSEALKKKKDGFVKKNVDILKKSVGKERTKNYLETFN